jgi:hypothetical protein
MPNFPSSGDSQAAAEAYFDAIHFAAVGFMIVAEKMEDAVEDEDAKFVSEVAAAGASVAAGDYRRNGDVSQKRSSQLAYARLQIGGAAALLRGKR